MSHSVAIVLAAGLGRKFFPYNLIRNKCAFPIGNEPLVARNVRLLRELGFSRIVVVVGHEEASIRAALHPLGTESLLFTRQPSGTSGTVPAALAGIQASGADAESYFVVYGDVVVSLEDLRATWLLHSKQGATASALCTRVTDSLLQDWIGCDVADERALGGKTFKSIEGHSIDMPYRLAGVYAFGKQVLPSLQNAPGVMTHVRVGGMPPLESEIAEVFANLLDERADVGAIESKKPCIDVDKRWHILDASGAVMQERFENLAESYIAPTASISDGAEIGGKIYVEEGATIGNRVVIEGNAWIGKNTRVINGAILQPSVIVGANTRISDYCLINGRTVVGNNCVVGHGGEADGVMLDGSYIYHYSEIFGVLGLAVDIGAATVCGTLRFDDGDSTARIRGRREHPRNGANATYFGDYSRTGVNVITQPGVAIGTYSCVGAGVVLYEDVPDRKLVLLKQETITRDWGPERYGW